MSVTRTLAFCTAFALAAPALAQEQATSLARLEVALWPEYDKAAVLVMYRAQLPAGTKLPAVVPLEIPAAVGEPHAVATRHADGGLFTATYSRTVHGDMATIAVNADVVDLQLEYYAPLDTSKTTRQLTWTWPGGIAIQDLAVEVQRPMSATSLRVEPGNAQIAVLSDGLTYGRLDLGPVKAQTKASVTATYTKSDAQLTAPRNETAQQAPAGQMPPPGMGEQAPAEATPPAGMGGRSARVESGPRDPVLWIVVGVIAVAFFAAGFFVSRGGRKSGKT
jgi:hypothetical protein